MHWKHQWLPKYPYGGNGPAPSGSVGVLAPPTNADSSTIAADNAEPVPMVGASSRNWKRSPIRILCGRCIAITIGNHALADLMHHWLG